MSAVKKDERKNDQISRSDIERWCHKIAEAQDSERELGDLVSELGDRSTTDELIQMLRKVTWSFVERQQYELALDVLDQLVELDPADLRTRIEIGKVHLRNGDGEAGFAAMEQAFDVALAQRNTQRCEEILGLMDRIEPGSGKTMVKRGEYLLAGDEEQQALAAFEKAASIFEDIGHRQEFLAVGKRILKLNPEDEAMRYKVGENLIAEARAFLDYQLHNKAISRLCEAIEYMPHQVETYEMLARGLVQVGRREDAVELLVSTARQFDEPLLGRELLMVGRELSSNTEQIDRIAEELGIDLTRSEGEEVVWDFPDDGGGELGDVETSVEYSQQEDSQPEPSSEDSQPEPSSEDTQPEPSSEDTQSEPSSEDTQPELRPSGEIIREGEAVRAVLETLSCVANCEKPVRVVVCRQQGAYQLEMIVNRGRIYPGVRIGNPTSLGFEIEGLEIPELTSVESEMIDLLWQQVLDGQTDAPEGLVDGERREILRHRVASMLHLVGRWAEDENIEIRTEPAATRPRFPVSFSCSSILVMFSRSLLETGVHPADEAPDVTAIETEETWKFSRFCGGKWYLPVEVDGNRQRPAFSTMRTAMDVARSVGEAMENVSGDDGDEERLAWSLVFEGEAWGAIRWGQVLRLMRVRTNQLGRLTRYLKGWTAGGES